MKGKPKDRKKRLIEWSTGGPYAVAVEVEAIYPQEEPSEPCFTPETIRYLEKLTEQAERGDLSALKKAGRVYIRLGSAAARSHARQGRQKAS
jgi:hypothetical protein